jgi:hypothetical protein
MAHVFIQTMEELLKLVGLHHDVSILDGIQNIKLTSFVNYESSKLIIDAILC